MNPDMGQVAWLCAALAQIIIFSKRLLSDIDIMTTWRLKVSSDNFVG